MLSVENLCKTYISKKGIREKALENISFQLPLCGLVFIVGKSGCGKTTLLNIIGGMDRPDSGQITVKSKQISSLNENGLDYYRNYEIGFVFQDYQLIDTLTAKENVGLALGLQAKRIEEDKISAMFSQLDLDGEQDKFVDELSGGQKQRVAIARALIKNPRILLADEPTGALDAKTGKELFKTLKKISKDRLVLVVSHDMDYAKEFADRIIELSDGKIISDTAYTQNGIENNANLEKMHKLSQSDIVGFQKEDNKRKSKLTLSQAFKFGVKGVFKRKFRLFATVVISLFALLTLGVFMSFISYDRDKIFVESMYASDNYYLPIVRRTTQAIITNEDISLMKSTFNKHAFVAVYDGICSEEDDIYFGGDFDFLIDQSSSMHFYTHASVVGTMEMDKNTAQEFGFSLLEGNYPTKDSEVMISDFFFAYFMDLGYRDYYTDEVFEINSYNDLLLKKFGSEDMFEIFGGYTISGILDTGFNFERYETLKQVDSNKGAENDLDIYFYELIENGAQRIVYVNQGFHERLPSTLFDEELAAKSSLSIRLIATALCGSFNTDIDLVSYFRHESGDDNTNYANERIYFSNDIMYQINRAEVALITISRIVLIVGVIAAFVSFLLMFNYLSATISDERGIIRILRMMGASKKDIMKIYCLRTLLIGTAVSFLSIFANIIIIKVINSTLAKSFFIYFYLFSFGLFPIISILLFCTFTSFVASTVPVLIHSKKYPLCRYDF